MIDDKATVAGGSRRPARSCVAKLTLGALAMGDRWFGGMTRSPWNPEQGLERLVGRLGLGGGGRAGRLRARQRDAGQHRLAVPGLRRHRACGRRSAGSAATAA